MIIRSFLALGLALILTTPAQAADPVQTNNSNAVWFENWIGLSNGLMRVATPEGDISDVRAELGTPVYQLTGDIVDGVYRYELRAATEEMVKNRDYSEDGLDGNDQEYYPKQFYRTGSFVVERGVILRPEDVKLEEKAD